LAGYPAVFVEHPEIARELKIRSLRLKIGEVETVLQNPQVYGSLEEALSNDPFDFAILAVKSFDTEMVLEQIKPYQESMPVIVSLQNGVENEALIRQVLGEYKVIAGSVTSAIGRRGPGDIILERLRGMGIASTHPRSGELVGALNRALLHAGLVSSEAGMKWSKMLTNLTANATSAILNMTPAEIYADPAAFRLDLAQMCEALRVMQAHRISVVNLPGVPVKLMAWVMRFPSERISQALLSRAVGQGRGQKMPSFHIDLYAGRGRSEVDYLNGAVVRFGKARGIDTPVNAMLTSVLLKLTTGEIEKQTYDHQPGKLMNLIKSSQ
jgi:2-dehydropantoate 2-reductase